MLLPICLLRRDDGVAVLSDPVILPGDKEPFAGGVAREIASERSVSGITYTAPVGGRITLCRLDEIRCFVVGRDA